jgi:hypothetical protein
MGKKDSRSAYCHPYIEEKNLLGLLKILQHAAAKGTKN